MLWGRKSFELRRLCRVLRIAGASRKVKISEFEEMARKLGSGSLSGSAASFHVSAVADSESIVSLTCMKYLYPIPIPTSETGDSLLLIYNPMPVTAIFSIRPKVLTTSPSVVHYGTNSLQRKRSSRRPTAMA